MQAGCHLPGPLTIPIAKTIKPVDTSTSMVIAAAGPQIQGGQAETGQHAVAAQHVEQFHGLVRVAARMRLDRLGQRRRDGRGHVQHLAHSGDQAGHASVVRVAAEERDDRLCLSVRDDGGGGADPARGSGLIGLKDRMEALGGTFSVHSPAGGGTTVSCELPVVAGSGQPDAGPGE